jgi:NAD+ kinase
MRCVGLIANPDKTACRPMVRQALAIIGQSRRKVLVDSRTAQAAGLEVPPGLEITDLARRCDLLLVFGGDGTMLRVSREVTGSRTPLLGINAGGLGFLTAIPSARLAEALERVWAGDYTLENRLLLAATGRTGERTIRQIALNDFVFGRGIESRMIELEVRVDQQVLTRYRCDGLIVSSPTGSTAYSLSAGGAVVCPTAEVMTITPICPHTLSNRSVVVSLDSRVQVKVMSRKLETKLTADGQVQIGLAAGDTVTIQRHRTGVWLMQLAGSSFFETLRQKLNWSGSNI